jgi:hypothetical protein
MLAAALGLPGGAIAQTETQSFSLQVPGPPASRPAPSPSRPPSRPSPVALPNRSAVTPAAAPLPRALAYTGTNPLPLVAAGLGVVLLSLLARRWSRARLRARAGV